MKGLVALDAITNGDVTGLAEGRSRFLDSRHAFFSYIFDLIGRVLGFMEVGMSSCQVKIKGGIASHDFGMKIWSPFVSRAY